MKLAVFLSLEEKILVSLLKGLWRKKKLPV
jgi:hypothetical protein